MTCPHCNYVSGVGWKEKFGDKGRFYILKTGNHELKGIRIPYIGNHVADVCKLYGCPNCKKLFLSEE
jgi:hypothetical protein